MSLTNMTLKTGGTLAVSGGTNLVFAADGTTIQNGVRLIVPADTAYATRRSATFSTKAATIQPDGDYSKIMRRAQVVWPMVLASGKTSFSTLRLELSIHPEAESSQREILRSLAAQILFATDADGFWTNGSTI